MVQSINFANTSTQVENTATKNIFQKAKEVAVQYKDVFEKSDEPTKLKINTALAGGSILGSVLTLIGARGKEVSIQGVKETFRKQNSLVKWIGALVSLVSSLAIVALNVNFKDMMSMAKPQEEKPAANTQSEVNQGA